MNEDSKSTILIIDDEAAIRESFTDFLQDLGYGVITAENGRIGLEKFKAANVDLIMVDLRMPEMDGIEVLKKVSRFNPEMPLIVVSGTGMITDAVDALHHGAWDYLLKPVDDFEILKHAVKNALEKSRLRKDLDQYQKHLEKMVNERTEELNLKTVILEKEVLRRRETEKELKELVSEKEVLLREIHHRVKNNMMVIISLMNLKANSLSNSAAKRILLDCENRVRSMALVHEMLYSSDAIGKISLNEYIPNLVNKIVESFSGIRPSVNIEYHIDDVTLNLDTLISIGLIINEIVSNSMKHAFSSVNEPKIFIGIEIDDENSIMLTISDNGPGIKKIKEFVQDNPVGIEIIKALVRQIDGSMKIYSEGHMKYICKFPE